MILALALTLNKTHECYDSFKEMVLHNLLEIFRNYEYIEIVLHENETVDKHYHAIVITKDKVILQELLDNKSYYGKKFHFEQVANIKKYINYMNNHDLVDKITYGDMPYIDNKDEGDKMAFDIARGYSVKNLLLRYGMKALRNMNNIKIYRELEKMEPWEDE